MVCLLIGNELLLGLMKGEAHHTLVVGDHGSVNILLVPLIIHGHNVQSHVCGRGGRRVHGMHRDDRIVCALVPHAQLQKDIFQCQALVHFEQIGWGVFS